MPKPYSEDLRARVIAAIEAGATRPEVAANPTTRPELDRDTAHTPQRRPRPQIIAMPMLRNSNTQKHTTQKFVTQ
jgi:hypothetical protein